MRYFRCKCGDSTAWSSMGTYPCDKCKKCGSSLAEGPDGHRDPIDHEFEAYPVESDQGEATLSRCKYCSRTKKQLGISETGSQPGSDREVKK